MIFMSATPLTSKRSYIFNRKLFKLTLLSTLSMKILIVSATEKEIAPLLEQLTPIGKKDSGSKKYSYKNHSIDVLITGIGMVASTYHLTKALAENKYDLALNLGIAGSFAPKGSLGNKKIKIGSVVNVANDSFSEMGAEDGDEFLSLIQIGLLKENEFPFTKGEIINSSKIKNAAIDGLQKVKGITANKVHGNKASIQDILTRFSPQIESMEGAAFLYVCAIEKIPCAQVRSISNYVERRNKENWNIPFAIENLNQKAIEILSRF